MKRLVVLISLSIAVGAFALACGGPEKPPLAPDTDHPLSTEEAGAPDPASTETPAETPPAN